MGWVDELIKNLDKLKSAISVSIFLAALIASGGLLFVEYRIPELKVSIPIGWRWVVFLIFFFTAVLLAIWLIELFARLIRWGALEIWHHYILYKLSEDGRIILGVMGEGGDEYLDLDGLDYEKHFSKVYVLDLIGRLEKAGLVRRRRGNRGLIKLTSKGQKYVLKHPLR